MFGNNPENFDLIYIGALGLSCTFCWADKDTLGALVILLGLWCLSRLLFISLEYNYFLILTYIISLIISIYCFDQIIAKVSFILILYCIGAEIYWDLTEYSHKPQIHYFVGMLSLTLLARELLFQRVVILHEYFGYRSGKIALDWQIRGILFFDLILIFLMLLEYFVRHLAGFNQVTIVYYNFTLIATALSGITLAVIYMHYFYNQSKKYMSA
ncbi:MAG: hypothetical protein ACI936_001327 [Paraglaciecola sp.]